VDHQQVALRNSQIPLGLPLSAQIEFPRTMPPQGISLEAVERELMLSALQKFNWNQTHAAKYLDISRKALMYRMEKHGIEKPATTPADEEDHENPR
jgi:DNA-binding NtrC family response regulator